MTCAPVTVASRNRKGAESLSASSLNGPRNPVSGVSPAVAMDEGCGHGAGARFTVAARARDPVTTGQPDGVGTTKPASAATSP